MNGPDNDLRSSIGSQLDQLAEEEDVDRLLETIAEAAEADVATGNFDDQSPDEVLAAVESWGSLASHVVARFYAPASPWPVRGPNLAGWAKSIASRLRRVVNALLQPLKAAATALQATSWSLGIGFPWGVSVELSWP